MITWKEASRLRDRADELGVIVYAHGDAGWAVHLGSTWATRGKAAVTNLSTDQARGWIEGYAYARKTARPT